MTEPPAYQRDNLTNIELANAWDNLKVYVYRKAASGLLPASWFEKRLPPITERKARTGNLHIEIVSHCWGYAHMMVYQLSSLVLYPPTNCRITMTVCYSEEDQDTVNLLDFFAKQSVPGIVWNWQAMHKYQLFRRSIGRNNAALESNADWVWFTDCDLIFHKHCLDSLSEQLQGVKAALVFPLRERTTTLLRADDPLLNQQSKDYSVSDISVEQFDSHTRSRATGPLQITHGDVARACGYCNAIAVFQKPALHWCKAHEDRVFRWLLQTQGDGIAVEGVYRIRHIEKGRYRADSLLTLLRRKIRRIQSRIRGE